MIYQVDYRTLLKKHQNKLWNSATILNLQIGNSWSDMSKANLFKSVTRKILLFSYSIHNYTYLVYNLVCKVHKSAEWDRDSAKCISYNIPQKPRKGVFKQYRYHLKIPFLWNLIFIHCKDISEETAHSGLASMGKSYPG